MRQATRCRLERFSNAADKEERDSIILDVVQEIYLSGGRFLKEDPGKNGWWEEVDQELAKEKVSLSFRDLKSAGKAATRAMTSETATTATIPSAATTVTTVPASHLSASGASTWSPVGTVHPAWSPSMGHYAPSTPSNPVATGSMSLLHNQVFDSSTYEFVEEFSSRGPKRHKTGHSDNNNCGWSF
jgi:hypothetical protein